MDRLRRWTVTYWGIPVREDGVLFCVDVSASMNFYDRLRDARRELLATAARLPRGVRFGVACFNDSVTCWQTRLVRAGPLAKHLLAAHLETLEAKRYTDLLGTLERVFGLAGHGRLAVPEPEPIAACFLLTDGLPSKQFVHDPDTIRRVVAAWNPGGRMVIHAVGLGMSDTSLLRGLAADHRGQFVKVGR